MTFENELSDDPNKTKPKDREFNYSDHVKMRNNIIRFYDSLSEFDEYLEPDDGGEKMNEYIEAIEYLKPISEHPTMTGEFCKHLKTAILSMQELLEREKSCEYCINMSKYSGFGYAEWFEQRSADDIYEIGIDVKFCPNCGRRLK